MVVTRDSSPARPEVGRSRCVAVVWQPAYIGVGSNLDDPQAQVRRAFARLAELPSTRVILTSPIYVSRPFGPVTQPDYANAVAGILTQLEPHALLEGLHSIEAAQGQIGRAHV